MVCGLCIPTNSPTTFRTKLYPSLKFIKELQQCSYLLFNFQHPWDEPLASTYVEDLRADGWKVSYRMGASYGRPAKMIAIRTQAAELLPDADIFMLCDDDMRFTGGTPTMPRSSGQRYLEALDYMQRFPRCGGVMCKGFFGAGKQGYEIRPVYDEMYATNMGLFLRNMTGFGFLLAPSDALNLRGALDESVMAASRIEHGFFFGLQKRNPTVHRFERIDGNVPEDDFHHENVIAVNARRYIRERYNNPEWIYPPTPVFKKSPVPYQVYLDRAGVDIRNPALPYGAAFTFDYPEAIA